MSTRAQRLGDKAARVARSLGHLPVRDRLEVLIAALAAEAMALPPSERGDFCEALTDELPALMRDAESGMREQIARNIRGGHA